MYTGYHEIVTYLRELHKFVEMQNRRIHSLEQKIQELQNSVQELRQRPSTNIERIEYKFDQLKVETLEGTLNIGLTPNGENIEDFSVTQGNMNVPDMRNGQQNEEYHTLHDSIHTDVVDYLDHDCYEFIREVEQQANHKLDDSYRDFIIDDIRNQIPERINYYLKQQQPLLHSADRLEEMKTKTVRTVINDIQNSIVTFMNNMPNEMKGGK
ncbi:spore germination protein GerPC [Bacillus sp. PS06]|uniref:spore germination protein GerPC n=1 Tax=Bacillus sp. PS06 TaxID=2764176 RepID=UPI0017827FC5|nr:spore germination protein GerPC [Bacillus sp. PS06]MBD8067593.1 spore gernimation protein [Bacillus sp. PS06]